MFIESYFVNLACSSMPRFRKKSNDVYNFRCPFCGDSTERKNKARGYIYKVKSDYQFHCHNCTATYSFSNFLKKTNTSLYHTYLLEKLRGTKNDEKSPAQVTEKNNQNSTDIGDLVSIDHCYRHHPAKKYLISRQIPSKYFSDLYYCPNFKEYTNSLIPGKFESTEYDEERIIIPLRSRSGKLMGFQGRSLDPVAQYRYITILLSEDYPKIFGLDRCDLNRQFFMFEGAFDSLFLPNSIAVCGSNITTELQLGNIPQENAVVVFDNQPRNFQIVRAIEKAILNNYSVVIFPEMSGKDINEYVLNGMSTEEITSICRENTFRGPKALLHFNSWKKV